MGLSEILKKQEPQPVTVAGLSGAGLGMAHVEKPHLRMANHFVRKYGGLESLGYEAETESPTECTEKEYRLCDFAIVDRRGETEKDTIKLVIEICHSGNYQEALDRIFDIRSKQGNKPEYFIFQYDQGIWEKIISKNKKLSTSKSTFLNGKDIMEGSMDYYNKVMKEYKE